MTNPSREGLRLSVQTVDTPDHGEFLEKESLQPVKMPQHCSDNSQYMSDVSTEALKSKSQLAYMVVQQSNVCFETLYRKTHAQGVFQVGQHLVCGASQST